MLRHLNDLLKNTVTKITEVERKSISIENKEKEKKEIINNMLKNLSQEDKTKIQDLILEKINAQLDVNIGHNDLDVITKFKIK